MELLLLIVSVTIVGQESDRTLDGKGDEATLTYHMEQLKPVLVVSFYQVLSTVL